MVSANKVGVSDSVRGISEVDFTDLTMAIKLEIFLWLQIIWRRMFGLGFYAFSDICHNFLGAQHSIGI